MNNEEIYKRIMVMESVKAATAFMKDSDISKSDLVKMCKKHDIFIAPKATKEEIIDRFISSTLGVKLKKKAVNKYKTK
ncbi:MAG TPA: hypothetical protein VLR72_02515 [Clostridiaceae bacterium]|nr:hypothetical protein [Clostridiaceae bacterium]